MNKIDELTERNNELEFENSVLSKACGDQINRIQVLERQVELLETGRRLTFQELLQRDLGAG